jgi:hypothetical protein
MNIVMLSVTNEPIMLGVIMLNVVAPFKHSPNYFLAEKSIENIISSDIKKLAIPDS